MSTRKTVAMQLPAWAHPGDLERRYALELEALAPIADLIEVPAGTAAELIEGLCRADAVITSWGIRLDREVIEALERCRVIGVGSVGVDMVDVDAATEAGIVVTNVPDVFIEEVADHAMMLLLAAVRRARHMGALAASGEWFRGRSVLSRVPRLWGQTLGLIAFGHVARATARRAKAFGLEVIGYDPYVGETVFAEAGVQPVPFEELLERADIVSLHAPLNEETHHMIAAPQLARMRPSGVIVNTARGPLIDEAALIEALEDGRLAAAGLDVLEQEPPATDNPLLSMDNVIISPHVASATTRMRPETRRRVGREVALVLRGRWPMSCVNPDVLPRTALRRWQPYSLDRGPNQ